MPTSPMPYAEYKDKLHASWQSQIDRGFLRFTLTYSLIGVVLYIIIFACVLFFRGRAYVASHHGTYWITLAVLMSFGNSAFNFYSLKRRVAKL